MTIILILAYLVGGALCVVPLSAAALCGWWALDGWLEARGYARQVEGALGAGAR